MLDPQTAMILQAIRSAPSLSTPPLEERRRNYDAMRSLGFGPAPSVGAIEEVEVPGASGPLHARLYRPPSSRCEGLLLHVHGGGFVAGSIEGYDKESRAFAVLGACSVLTFEYRLAPENRFPAAVEDVNAVLSWTSAHARDLDYAGEHASMQEFAELPTLSRSDVVWARDQYLRSVDDRKDWRASPLRAPSLAGVAPALILTAECDVLRDEGEAYARRLEAECVPTRLRRIAGMPHGFFSMGAFVDAARRAVDETGSALREALQ